MIPITLSINSTITRGAFQRDLSTSLPRPCNRQWLAVNSPYATTNESIRTEAKAIAGLFQFPHKLNDLLLLCGNGAGCRFPRINQPRSFRSDFVHNPKQNTSERFKSINSNVSINLLPAHGFNHDRKGFQDVGKFVQKSGKTSTKREQTRFQGEQNERY